MVHSALPLPLAAQPQSTAVSLQTYALAAIAAQISDPSERSPEIQFLLSQLRAITAGSKHWMETLSAYVRQPTSQDMPLLSLVKSLKLTLLEVLTVALAQAVEADVMVGRALARLQAPLGGSRPTMGLLMAAFTETVPAGRQPLNTLLTGAAMQSGLLQRLNETAPLPEQMVSVPLHLCLALSGYDGNWAGTTIGLDGLTAVPLPTSIQQEAERHALSLRSPAQRVVVLRTGSIAEGKSVAIAIAQSLNCRPLFIETEKTDSLFPWLLLRQLLPVFCFDLAPGERKILPILSGYHGAMLVLCGPDGSVESPNGTALNWSIPVPNPIERQQLWEVALGDSQMAIDLAQVHRHSSGRIAQLGKLAHHHSGLKGEERPTSEDVVAAAWSGEGVGLDALAQALTDPIADDVLVLPSALQKELNTLLLRCRSRDRLIEGLGISATARYHPGVRALFVGASGTGKTLAVGWLATKLGLPLYRVDLASITSKYIGETEKNLAQLLARAEQAEVVLLFDEADALFGKRTDVQDANDRFANSQTNYLLQRIETFDGIAILTSNSRSRFDAAFTRRLDLIIEFPMPGPEERRSLWQSHLGNHHTLTSQDLNQLAATTDLGGGNIRNVVLAAAVVANSQNRAIAFSDVIQGLASEYRKLGRQLPVGLKDV